MKSMRKLTIKNLLLNKTRTLVTMVGILISAALITLVACMALSIQQTAVNLVAQRSGNYTASLYGKLTNTDFEKYQKDSGVQNAFVQFCPCRHAGRCENTVCGIVAVDSDNACFVCRHDFHVCSFSRNRNIKNRIFVVIRY